jgi:hypothetical protein
MAHAIEQLLSSEMLSEEVRNTLSEAWEAKLSEAREEITAELREEFANRYENDKAQMVEALDAMLGDTIRAELEEFAADKRAAVEAKVAYQRQIAEHAQLLDQFVMESLKGEINELREDRKLQESNFEQLEGFVMEQLATELNEFHQDKQELLAEKVRLVKEGKKMIAEAKTEFVSKASAKLATIVESTLSSELGMLKEDIQLAKENMFGRKIFETFAAEFMSSHLAEGTQVSKLSQELLTMKEALAESKKVIAEKESLIETNEKKAKRIAESQARKDKLSNLLSPLAKDKRELMSNLLESVATSKLEAAYNKYLPTVLNESTGSAKQSQKLQSKQLNEARTSEITGNKAQTHTTESDAEIINLRKLAGIN